MAKVDNLPQTFSGKRMLSFVAPIYEKSFWLKSYFDALGVDFDTLLKYFSTLRNQTHVPTVDWGIEFLERKYSIVPDANLTLEQRRERLRIKAAVHLPLNPAVIEKFAREHFDFECFLDEATPGYIYIIANHFTVDAPKFVTWLVEEKPAHLAIGGRYLRTQYIGEEKFAVPNESPRIEFDSILPIDDADKKHFPRLFAGAVEVQVGLKTFDIARPHDIKGTVYVGQALGEFGGKKYSLARPFIFDGNRHQLYAAQTLTKGGGLTINADLRDLPTYENIIESPFVELALADIALARDGRFKIPVEVYERYQRANLFMMAAQHVSGSKVYDLHRPENLVVKRHVGQILESIGVKTIQPSTKKSTSQIARIGIGQVFGRTGIITIDSSTKPSLADNELFFVERLDLNHGNAVAKLGSLTVKPSPKFKDAHLTTIHVGNGLVRAGEIKIDSATKPSWSDSELFFVKRLELNHGEILTANGLKTIAPTNRINDAHLTTIQVGQSLIRSGDISIT
ncbi:MAG: DUF2313 domain-containing protein [Selenomonadaceae bacterium]|nr:DUF2313 domain-containing protein [Selenomonadaceae bacterium]